MKPLSASHRRAADATSVLSTVTRSKVERLMTLSTSAVAVCCCSDSLRSVVRWRSSFSSRVFLEISYMYRLLFANGPPHYPWAVELHPLPAPQVAANFADGSPDPHHAVFDDNNVNKLRLADAGGMFGNRLENRCYVARRARDHGQDIADRGLLLQRLRELARARLHLVEQPHVLDRNHRLVGEGRCQFDLFVGKRPYFAAINSNHADQIITLNHGYGGDSANPADLGTLFVVEILIGKNVLDLDRLLFLHSARNRRPPLQFNRVRLHEVLEFGRIAIARHLTVCLSKLAVHRCHFGLAQPRR